MKQYRRLEMRVDTAVLAENARIVKRALGGTRMMAVVKADGYGHGADTCARVFLKNGASALAVATVEEALSLRQTTRAPILVLGATTEDGARECVRSHIALALYDETTLFAMQAEAKKLDTAAHAHLKIDTGMSRIGLVGEAALKAFLAKVKACPNVRIEGVFTHFASSDEDSTFTLLQNARFQNAVEIVRAEGFHPLVHAAASAACLMEESLRYDMARPGIALYGAGVNRLCPALEPAQTLSAYPVRIQRIEKGETVGYGRTFTAMRDSVIMTLPVGYGDGYPRALSNVADVLVRGKRAPVVGRICMDMTMADVTEIEGVSMEDEVILLGKQGEERIAPDELARLCGTIPYEIMLGFHQRVPRKEI